MGLGRASRRNTFISGEECGYDCGQEGCGVGKVITHPFWILSASAFNKASSIILVLVLSRYLGAADFGRFSFAFFYVTLFSAIAEVGITTVLIRRLRTEPGLSGEIFLKGVIMGLSSTLLAVALLVACAFAFFDAGMTTL